jgi:hypothetical protein
MKMSNRLAAECVGTFFGSFWAVAGALSWPQRFLMWESGYTESRWPSG